MNLVAIQEYIGVKRKQNMQAQMSAQMEDIKCMRMLNKGLFGNFTAVYSKFCNGSGTNPLETHPHLKL